jgi:hypothetical protein
MNQPCSFDNTEFIIQFKEVPATVLFNVMSFSNGWLGEKDRHLVSDVRIVKMLPIKILLLQDRKAEEPEIFLISQTNNNEKNIPVFCL